VIAKEEPLASTKEALPQEKIVPVTSVEEPVLVIPSVPVAVKSMASIPTPIKSKVVELNVSVPSPVKAINAPVAEVPVAVEGIENKNMKIEGVE
jgi:hypothetical protein